MADQTTQGATVDNGTETVIAAPAAPKKGEKGYVDSAPIQQVYNPLSDMKDQQVIQFTFQEFRVSPFTTATGAELWNAWGTVISNGKSTRIPLLALKESADAQARLTVGQTYKVTLRKNAKGFIGGSIVCNG
jgi:hypothetical protein